MIQPFFRSGIVVIGRNEGDRLKRCLASLPGGTVGIVYVDSASTDGSQAHARAAGAVVVDLDMSRPFTAARARNEGLVALRLLAPEVELVQFIDGDCALAPGWLPAATAFLDAHSDVAVVCGRRREQHPDASIYNRMCDAEWNTPIGEAAACGGDALMRVSAIVSAGCYDATLTAGEEPELCARLRHVGWRIWRIDVEMTSHDAAMTKLSQWWRRNVRSGYGYSQAWRRTRQLGTPIFGRQLARALVWGLALPLLMLTAAALMPRVVLGLLLLYAVQFARLAIVGRCRDGGPLAGALLLAAKFPEVEGIVRYALAGQRRDAVSAQSYKG